MTLKQWIDLYSHYKNHYDFTLSKRTYKELEEYQEKAQSDEWYPN